MRWAAAAAALALTACSVHPVSDETSWEQISGLPGDNEHHVVVFDCAHAHNYAGEPFAEAYFYGKTAAELTAVIVLAEGFGDLGSGSGYFHEVLDEVYVKDEWVATPCKYVSVTFVLP